MKSRPRGGDPNSRGARTQPELRDSEGNIRVGQIVAGPVQLPLEGAHVDQFHLDRALTVTLDTSGRSWALRIEGDFDLAQPGGSTERFGRAPPSSWRPAVDVLLHQAISDASIARDGTLHLRFVGGCRIEVPPTCQWEAWQLNGPNGELIVCGPGGRLSKWPTEPDEDPRHT
jgi:hypothetical protein